MARSDSFAAVPDFHKLYPTSRQILADRYTMATQDIVNGPTLSQTNAGHYEPTLGWYSPKRSLGAQEGLSVRKVATQLGIPKSTVQDTVGEKSIAPPPIFDTPNSYLLYNKLDENIFKIIKILHGCTPIYSALIYVIYFKFNTMLISSTTFSLLLSSPAYFQLNYLFF